MDNIEYIRVILPLHLAWEPAYRLETDGDKVAVGDRIRVPLSGREYIGVVSAIGITPDIESGRIQRVIDTDTGLDPVSLREIELWRFVSEYYMCSVGEVYKVAYPSTRTEAEEKNPRRKQTPTASPARKKQLDETDKEAVRAILEAFQEKETVLLQHRDISGIFCELAARTITDGGTALILTPDINRCKALAATLGIHLKEKVITYGASDTAAAKRDTATTIRSGTPLVVVGTKAAVFLPFSRLDLILIDNEQSPAYKQDACAPRYNGRDTAAVLASLHDANLLFSSSTPSLDAEYNCQTGRYKKIHIDTGTRNYDFQIISTNEEKRKNGMVGSLSRKLLTEVTQTLERKGRILIILPWKDSSDTEIELRKLFPKAGTKLVFASLLSGIKPGKYSLVAILQADFLTSRQDFKADEKAVHLIGRILSEADCPVIIQTSDAAHPIFSILKGEADMSLLLNERKSFSMPPFTRLLEISINDTNGPRRAKMSAELASSLGGMRFLMPKTKSAAEEKKRICRVVSDFEKEKKYFGHIILDADPK